MSLGIKIIDKFTNNILNLDKVKFGILIDDSIRVIKEKIFTFLGFQYYPNFLKLEVKKDDKYLILLNHSSLEFSLNDDPSIYVSTIFNITDKNEYLQYDLSPYSLYNKLKEDNIYINNLYEDLLKEFIDLTMDDLIIIINMKMIDFVNEPGNEMILSQSEKENIIKEITTHFNNIEIELKSKKKFYITEQQNLQNLYDEAYNLKDLTPYYNLTPNKDRPLFNFTNIVFSIKGYQYESGISGKFIKLQQIFNRLELSEEIPFIVYNMSKTTPMVKVYNKIIDTVSDNTIKSWILNEKKKLNQVSYKKVKGLLFKYQFTYDKDQIQMKNYLTILLNENGLITVKITFNEDDKMQSIEKIKLIIQTCIDKLVNNLNELQGIYSMSKRLQLTDMSIIKIESINASLTTNELIDLESFRRMMTQVEIRKIFEIKETISKEKDKKMDVLLMYYKKFGKRDQDDSDSERKGITVNIRDNLYRLNSSLINIYGAYNLTQLQTIANHIIITFLLMQKPEVNNQIATIFDDLRSEEEEKKLKEKSNIKILRQRGVKIFSSKCQKPRQPIIDDGLEIDRVRTMIYEGNRYICPNDVYPYPGFTPDNIPCCFKFQGKGMAQNIKNTPIFETKVQPSNFMVTIEDPDQQSFETNVIKIVSDSENGFNISAPYYYISYKPEDIDFPLKHIHNQELIDKIKQKESQEQNMTMWLETVPLSQLISKPSKSKCQHQPEFDQINKSNVIHDSCKHHEKNLYFGYNINSYPCCFDKERPVFNIRKAKEKDSTKQHILITDKLLSEKRQGLLPPGLNKLLNEIIQPKHKGTFLRWGVNQNQLSFFNCILEAIENKIGNVVINNTTELKRYLINYLQENQGVFDKLNGGTISLKYSKIDDYINEIEHHLINWKDIIDLISRALKCNILILDIPYIETESTKTFDYNNIKLVCNLLISIDKSKPFIILIKKQQAFEIIIYNTDVKWNKSSESIEISKKKEKELKSKSTITFIFNYNPDDNAETNIINFLLDYYTSTCVKENEYPENFSYDELYNYDEIIKSLNKTSHKIYFQLVNSFNKVNLLVTKRGFIIPIKETGIINGIPRVSFEEYIKKGKSRQLLLDINLYENTLTEINKYLSIPIKLLGVTTISNKINGVMTNFGQIIPLKTINIDEMTSNLPLLPIKYYYDVDLFLSNKETFENSEIEWNKKIELLKDKIYQVKKYLGEKISSDDNSKTLLIKIIKNPSISRSEKINDIFNYLKNKIEIFEDIEAPLLDFILKHIANEMINDNIENLLLNNLVTSDVFNPDEIIKRNNESIWLNIDDIRKWIKKFKTQE